jgi:hypothetical protein
MDYQFRILILTDFTGNIYSLDFRFSMCGGSIGAALLDVPPAFRSRDYMMRFVRHFVSPKYKNCIYNIREPLIITIWMFPFGHNI